MNEHQQSILNWVGRVLTWIIPIAVIVYQAGAQGQQITNLDKRVQNLEVLAQAQSAVAQTQQTNSYKLSSLDVSVTNISKRASEDHDTLTRIDQTMKGINEALVDLRSEVKNIAKGVP